MLIISSLSQVRDKFRCELEKCTGSHVVGIRSLKVGKKKKQGTPWLTLWVNS